MSNRQDLSSKLAKARQQLQKIQAQVADLEAQLLEEQPKPIGLVASEDRYYQTLENMLEGCQIIGFDWRYLYMNRAAVSHGQRAKDKLLGHTMMECYPGIEKTELFAVLQRCMQDRIVENMENEFIYVDGTTAWFDLSIEPAPEGIFILSLDMTERKLAEKAESEQRLLAETLRDSLAVLTTSLDVETVMKEILAYSARIIPSEAGTIILFEGDQGRVAYSRGYSPEAEAFFKDSLIPLESGLFMKEYDNKDFYLAADTKSTSGWVTFPFTEWIRSSIGVPILLRGETIGLLIADSRIPNRFQQKDVEYLKAFARYAALALENAYHVDQLEQRVNERTAELQAAKERVEAILNNSADGILLVHPDFTIQQTNAAFNKLFACEPDDYFNQPLTALFHASDDPTTQTIQTGVVEGQVINIEVRARRQDQSQFDAELRIGFIKKGGFVCSIRDISDRKQAQMAVDEERNLLRTLIDAVPDYIYIKDTQHRFILTNNAHAIARGVKTPEELTGKTDFDYFPPDLAEQFRQEEAAIFQTGAPLINKEQVSVGYAGGFAWASANKVALRNMQGKLIGLVGITRDITETKRVAAELERQRSFLRSVIDVSPNMIFVKDYEGKFVLVNPMVANMYNTTVDDMIGKTDADFNPSLTEVDNFLEADRRVISSGETLFIEEPITSFSGETHWLHTRKVPIISIDGNSKYVLGVATDITERKQSEAALKESEEKYRSLIETMRGGLALYDLDERITYINDRFCELLGYTRDELIGTHSYDYVDSANAKKIKKHVEQRQRLESSSYELVAKRKDSQLVWLLVSGSPLLDKAGNLTGSFAVMTDITAQKQAEDMLRQAFEKERELGELKTRFVSMASHEFRTPLATILALTETLSAYRHKLPEDQIEVRFDKIKDQVGHLKDIMEDVLQLARMQARRLEFNPVNLDLDALCRSVLDEFQSRADVTQRIEYACHTALRQVILDKKLMRQIISNLVSNAIKYSPEAKPIKVNLDFAGGALVLSVRDEGIGIPEADLPHLFEPFHRAANVGTISGTGLGLVITKESVELHGGTIEVASQPGIGTTFIVAIPIAAQEQN